VPTKVVSPFHTAEVLHFYRSAKQVFPFFILHKNAKRSQKDSQKDCQKEPKGRAGKQQGLSRGGRAAAAEGGFFLGRGSVAPTPLDASQYTIEPIEPILILIYPLIYPLRTTTTSYTFDYHHPHI